ncbi:MAG: BrnA antitoxin family protein [Deltaproteobacteria bacterium]|nr:BrnA antitoxin family protein [Deltaproteobacteria bacterium]
MRDEYDLSEMKPQKNPYAKRLKKQITIRLGEDVLSYFKEMAAETGMPYQRLIDLYLRDCMTSARRLTVQWQEQP